MATTTLGLVTLVVVLCTITVTNSSTVINLGYKPIRPPFAGATGGHWVNYAGQRVPLGKPWPSRPEDYPSFSATTGRITTNDSPKATGVEEDSNVTTVGTITELTSDSNDTYQGTSQEETKTESYGIPDDSTSTLAETTKTPKLPVPNRPPFLGPTGGNFIPQIIPPGKPWPARPEDYNLTTEQSLSQETVSDSFIDKSTTNKFEATLPSKLPQESATNEVEVNVPPKLPAPNRPPFLGPTGGNFVPQLVPPGKPWPARPEDYEFFSVTSQRPNVETSSVANEVSTSPNLSVVNSSSLEVPKPQTQTQKPLVDKITFPDDPILDNEIKLETDSAPESNVFSVAFYFGDTNSKTQSENGSKKPSLSISVNLNALKGVKAGVQNDKETDIMKATEHFLESEKNSGSAQSKKNYSVLVNLKDILSSKKASTRINISHLSKETEETEKGKQEILTSKKNVTDKMDKVTKNPLMSVFFNLEDFRAIGKYSTKSKSTKDSKHFSIYPGR